MKTATVALTCAVLVGGMASIAHADPIVVTSGSLSHDSDFGPSGGILFLVADSTFNLGSLFVTMDPLPGTRSPLLQPGQTVAFNTRVTSFGQAFSGNGELRFSSSPVTLPTELPLFGSESGFKLPFTMTGFLDTRTLTGAPAFKGDVAGAGSLSVLLRANGRPNGTPPGFFLEDATFTFVSANPAPTPEPATVLLIGSSLLCIVARRGRFSKRQG